jgi:hypothetical protein
MLYTYKCVRRTDERRFYDKLQPTIKQKKKGDIYSFKIWVITINAKIANYITADSSKPWVKDLETMMNENGELVLSMHGLTKEHTQGYLGLTRQPPSPGEIYTKERYLAPGPDSALP